MRNEQIEYNVLQTCEGKELERKNIN